MKGGISVPILMPAFLIFWVILNGKITIEIVAFGMLISILVGIFAYGVMGFDFSKEKKISRKLVPVIIYLIILVYEVIKANFYMINLVLSPKIEIEPKLRYFTVDLKSTLSKVVLADSITLTPGTITVLLVDDEYLIHAIDEEVQEGIEESIFVKKLKELEG